jgi:hypothetical protein
VENLEPGSLAKVWALTTRLYRSHTARLSGTVVSMDVGKWEVATCLEGEPLALDVDVLACGRVFLVRVIALDKVLQDSVALPSQYEKGVGTEPYTPNVSGISMHMIDRDLKPPWVQTEKKDEPEDEIAIAVVNDGRDTA